tara:strand:- start:53042 stop:53212 length:171 start_codon:yes stop_codon:yes gene_type:complete
MGVGSKMTILIPPSMNANATMYIKITLLLAPINPATKDPVKVPNEWAKTPLNNLIT